MTQGTAARMSRCDFFDFIERRNRFGRSRPYWFWKPSSLTSEDMSVVLEFRESYLGLSEAISLLNIAEKAKMRDGNHIRSQDLILIAYATMLPANDARALQCDPTLVIQDRKVNRVMKPGETYLYKALKKDKADYLNYWISAFPERLTRLLSDSRYIATVHSAKYHGVDAVTEVLAAAADLVPDDLIEDSIVCKRNLSYHIDEMIVNGLIEITFDPEKKHPELFERGRFGDTDREDNG